MTPKRIQLRRTAGWRMPENTVKVDRTTHWGNPFVVGQDGTREMCVDLYKKLLGGLLCVSCKASTEFQRMAHNYVATRLQDLRGHDLACWCPLDQPCHADVLLQLANTPIADKTEA
jgi:hypothetical protein